MFSQCDGCFDSEVARLGFFDVFSKVLLVAPMSVFSIEYKPKAAVEEQARGHDWFASNDSVHAYECA